MLQEMNRAILVAYIERRSSPPPPAEVQRLRQLVLGIWDDIAGTKYQLTHEMRSSAETPLEPAMAEAVPPSVVRSTMPNHLVVDSPEDTTAAASHPTSVPAYVYLARRVSTLLAPAPVSGLLVLFVALYHTHTLLIAFPYAAVTFFSIGLGPLVFVLLGVHSGKLSDIDLSHRNERTGPFLFGFASAMLGLFVLLYLHGPKALETVLICTAVGGMVLMVTTWWWKISVHAATLAGAVTMLT